MTRNTRGLHHRVIWEAQPLVRSADRPRPVAMRLVVLAFIAGLLVGLVI
ncbi:hypothetical protein OVY48_09975 [Sphingobium sp. SA2]|nr:hypothetical protein [Sphingobium sp. SA2]MDT7533751.1 hypothetical protein [Sphingobium sp. SA2]